MGSNNFNYIFVLANIHMILFLRVQIFPSIHIIFFPIEMKLIQTYFHFCKKYFVQVYIYIFFSLTPWNWDFLWNLYKKFLGGVDFHNDNATEIILTLSSFYDELDWTYFLLYHFKWLRLLIFHLIEIQKQPRLNHGVDNLSHESS